MDFLDGYEQECRLGTSLKTPIGVGDALHSRPHGPAKIQPNLVPNEVMHKAELDQIWLAGRAPVEAKPKYRLSEF